VSRAKRDSDDEQLHSAPPAPSARSEEEGAAAVESASAGVSEPDEEGAIDLDDLDAHGVEGIVASRKPEPTRRERPAWISLFVIALALPLLVRMYPDFRYWLRSSSPEDLGAASSFVESGEVPRGYNDRYVVLRGTPDVRNIAIGKGPRETVRYMRLMESDGQLLAVVRTPIEQDNRGETVRYPGEFEGRMTRLGDLGRRSWLPWSEPDQYQWLARFYEIENISHTVDATPAALLEALEGRASEGLTLMTAVGDMELAGNDRVRLVVEHPEVRVLFGGSSFSREQAQAAMESLGVPFVAAQSRDEARHRYVARIPAERRAQVEAELRARIEGEINTADPRQGVTLLPLTSTFVVAPDDLELQGATLTFPRGDNTSTAGYEISGETLRERDPTAAMVSIPRDGLGAVRIERAIRLDPDGYVLLQGEKPSDQRMFGVLWIFTAAVTLANAAAIGMWLRRRRAARA